jgi:tetratricopeptide (TPR) repeat protein
MKTRKSTHKKNWNANVKVCFLFLILAFYLNPSFGQAVDDWLVEGDMHVRRSSFQEALNSYNRYINYRPDDPVGYLSRAKIYELLDMDTKSEFDINTAKSLNPLALMYINPTLRSKYVAKKYYEFNYADLDDAFIKTPSRVAIYKEFYDQQNFEKYNEALILEVVQSLANFDLFTAENLIQEIEADESNEAIILDLQAKLLMKKGQFVEANKLFTKAIELRPSFALAYHNRGVCNMLLNRPAKAEDDFRSAINLSSDIPLFIFSLAKLKEQNGNVNDAIKLYEDALNLDANYKEAVINYSQLLKNLGQYEKGLDLVSGIINNSEKESEEIFFLRGNLNLIHGEYEAAIDDYEVFLREFPNDPEALFNEGLSQILLRDLSNGCLNISASMDLESNEQRNKIDEAFCNGVRKY